MNDDLDCAECGHHLGVHMIGDEGCTMPDEWGICPCREFVPKNEKAKRAAAGLPEVPS